MHDRYDLNMSRQLQQLYMVWDRQFPVSVWEAERNRRIAAIIGHENPFVTGKRSWRFGHRNTGDGIFSELPLAHPVRVIENPAGKPIIGNRNSNIYHLPQGCPSYSKVAVHNQVHFQSEGEALRQGFRKAKNCR